MADSNNELSVLLSFFCEFIVSCIHHTMSIVPYVGSSSSTPRKKRSSRHLLVHKDMIKPEIGTPKAQTKYRTMMYNLKFGAITSFNSFPDILEKFSKIDWNCLVQFQNKCIYPVALWQSFMHTWNFQKMH